MTRAAAVGQDDVVSCRRAMTIQWTSVGPSWMRMVRTF